MSISSKEELCHYCGQSKTKNKDSRNLPICDDCVLKQRAQNEPKRNCPVDNSLMEKDYYNDGDIFIDRCPKCQGVWLESDKFETIIEALYNLWY